MRYLALLMYFLMTTTITVMYSDFFNIDFIGKDIAVMGYKVLWGVIGMGYVYFNKWIMDR